MAESHSPWLDVSQLSKTVWRILDAGMVSEYLILGEGKALLVDCGWGIGDLSGVVSGLTSLPLAVANTHGHPDHTCGDYRFGDVFIHEGDVPMLSATTTRRCEPIFYAGSRSTRSPTGSRNTPGPTLPCPISRPSGAP